MSISKTTKEAAKKQKAKNRQTIAEKIDLALGEYKYERDEKKYQKGLKKASKLLSKVVVIPVAKNVDTKKSPIKPGTNKK